MVDSNSSIMANSKTITSKEDITNTEDLVADTRARRLADDLVLDIRPAWFRVNALMDDPDDD